MTLNTNFELARLQILSIFYSNNKAIEYHYIYAWSKRIFPICSAHSPLIKSMSSGFEHNFDCVKEIFNILDQHFANQQPINFPILMAQIKYSIGSHELENICRYLFLSDSLPEKLWLSFKEKEITGTIDFNEINVN